MPDWKRVIRRHLPLPVMKRLQEEKIIEELAGQLEDFYREALQRGLNEEEAVEDALAHISDWEAFASDIAGAQKSNLQPASADWLENRRILMRRQGRMGTILADLLADLLLALRRLRKSPGFSIISLLVLAIGIGGVTVMYATLDGVVLQPLPYDEPQSLIWVWGITPLGGTNTVSAEDYFDYREQCGGFESLAAYYTFRPMALLSGDREADRVPFTLISHNFFSTLRVPPQLGRTFDPEEVEAGARDTVIISHGLWQRRFGGDPGILGTAVGINGSPCEIIGVMPAAFDFPAGVDLWLPMKKDLSPLSGRDNRNFRVFGRLAKGVTLEEAQAQASAAAGRLAEAYPDMDKGWGLRLLPMHEVFFGSYRLAMSLLMGAVALLLLVACGNISALFLSRFIARRGEIALRLAMGATRSRIIAQLLVESLVIAGIGGGFGLLLAQYGIQAVKAYGPPALPRMNSIEIDLPVVVFAALISLLAGVSFGCMPALRGTRVELAQSLQEVSHLIREPADMRLRGAIVVFQVALSMILLIGSGLLIRSFLQLKNVEPGFQTENLLLAVLQLPLEYDTPAKRSNFYSQMLQRLQAIPGVDDACAAERQPYLSGGFTNDLYPAGRPPVTAADRLEGFRNRVSQNFFTTLGIPISTGRTFQPEEMQGSPRVVIINQTMARILWPGENALGKIMVLFFGDQIPLEVIGVAGDVREAGPDSDYRPSFYLPMAQFPPATIQIAVRTRVDPEAMTQEIRQALMQLDKNVPVSGFHTMDSRSADRVAMPRFRTYMLIFFSAVASLIASLGLYGVLSFYVGQKSFEMGMRMALGASGRHIVGMILTKGMVLVGIGIVVGFAGGYSGARFMQGLLFQTAPDDFATFVLAAVVLLATAFLACLFPALRAARVDPSEALKAG